MLVRTALKLKKELNFCYFLFLLPCGWSHCVPQKVLGHFRKSLGKHVHFSALLVTWAWNLSNKDARILYSRGRDTKFTGLSLRNVCCTHATHAQHRVIAPDAPVSWREKRERKDLCVDIAYREAFGSNWKYYLTFATRGISWAWVRTNK